MNKYGEKGSHLYLLFIYLEESHNIFKIIPSLISVFYNIVLLVSQKLHKPSLQCSSVVSSVLFIGFWSWLIAPSERSVTVYKRLWVEGSSTQQRIAKVDPWRGWRDFSQYCVQREFATSTREILDMLKNRYFLVTLL